MPKPSCYELRTYWTHPGRRDALHQRFQKRTIGIFRRCGMDVIGFWNPLPGPGAPANHENMVVYLLRFKDRESRDKSWQAFGKDPEWPIALKESEAVGGPIVDKAESIVLDTVDFSPEMRRRRGAPRLFELRTYTATPGNRERLVDRFRRATFDLFRKHGIENGVYGIPQADQPGAADKLIYFVMHKDAESRSKSFAAFGADPAWKVAREASEAAAGGSLTIPGGVESLLLVPTDYSPLK